MDEVEKYKSKLKGKFQRKFNKKCKMLDEGLLEEARESIPQEDSAEVEGKSGGDIIIVSEGCKSCETLVDILSIPILNQKIEVMQALSNRGQAIISVMPDDIALPLYVTHDDDGYHKHPLKELIRKYATKQ